MTDDEKNLGYPPQSPGRYVFKSPLGAGAFANAWAAKDTKTKQDVAIKVLDKMSPGNEPKVLRAEALALQHVAAKLPDHPHIAGLIDIYEDGLSLYIVLQLCT